MQWSDLSPVWKNCSCLCILFIKTRFNGRSDLFIFNQQHLPPPQVRECCTKTCHETSVWSGWRCTRAPLDPTSTTSCSLSAATSLTTSIRFLLRYWEKLLTTYFQAANLLPVLRARICGYTGIFRIVESFWPSAPGSGMTRPTPQNPDPNLEASQQSAPQQPQEPQEVEPAGIKKSESGGFFASLFKS